jgi:hypothetical protein
MKSATAVLTIASANYLPYVKTLMQSLRDTNPEYRRYLFLADKGHPVDVEAGDLFEVVEADQLGIKCFDDMVTRYDVMELNTAIKPFAIDWLFNETDVDNVIYLDPDICVYRRLTELDNVLASGASAVVTPHITKPLEDGKTPNDYHMLQSGVFNLGFIAISRKDEAREFVRWWSRKLETQCFSDVARSLFTDQKWVDLAPCFLSDLKILRNPAYNVAYWNLMQRPVSNRRGKLTVGGEELAFFHFSGLERSKPTTVSKHQDRLKWQDIKPLQNLFKSYRAALGANGWDNDGKAPYHYNRIGSLEISPILRRLYREQYPDAAPKSAVDEEFLIAMCNQPTGLSNDSGGRVSRLMMYIYLHRPDLQSVFSLSSAEGIEGFIGWYKASAKREYHFDDRLIEPQPSPAQPSAPAALTLQIPGGHPNQAKPWWFRQWRKLRRWTLTRVAG